VVYQTFPQQNYFFFQTLLSFSALYEQKHKNWTLRQNFLYCK